MPRITKIYTRKGDDGETSLGSRTRVQKDDLRVQAYGTVDELNSVLGTAVAADICTALRDDVLRIQNELFHLGSDLCFPEEDKKKFNIPEIAERHVKALEKLIDHLSAETGPLENFILPGGTPAAAALHVARTVCRRAERETVALAKQEAVGKWVIGYLNRLSDALFAMARFENHQNNVKETLWDSRI